VAVNAGVALVYFGAARFGLSFAVVAEQVSPVWPPSGIALAALLVLGYRAWPGVWLGAAAANLLANETVPTALAVATGNVMEAVAGAWLLRRAGFRESIDRVWDVMALLGLAAGLSTVVGATVGTTALCLGGAQPWATFGGLWFVWWLGDAMGILLFAPALLIWGSRPRVPWELHRGAEAIALGACIVAASIASFGGTFVQLTGSHFAYFVFPLLIWAALRFGSRGAAPAIVVVAGVAVAFTVRGYGPFGVLPEHARLVMMQIFLGVAALTALVLGAAVAERDAAERRRRADYAVAWVMARSATLEDAAPQILKAICESLEWDLGALWVIDPGDSELRCFEVWNKPGLRAPEFVAMTRELRFGPGVGLPGRVWQAREPAWISDVLEDPNYLRGAPAARAGLHAAFAFPISLGDETLGVIDFISCEIRRPDEALLQLFTSVGSQIGQFIDRKRSEAELRRASEAKDQFLALLGHELRNPLAPIRNALEVLRTKKDEPLVAAQMHEIMQRQTAHMVRLVDDLLDVSRITRGKVGLRRERVDLGTAVRRTAEAMQPLLEERGHRLSVSLPSAPVAVDADPTRLEQVLSNLLVNAARFTPDHGTISFSVAREGDQAVISVRDDGIGIRREMLNRIFDAFAQADRLPERVQEGLGLGLTLVRSLVEMHGGTVTVASEGTGRGSEFVVRLPCLPGESAPAPKPARAPQAQHPAATARRRRVMVVDDNVDSAESLTVLLQLAGHEVRMAHDGPSALVLAREYRPEVVLLDIGLPAGMDGYEVAQRLRPDAGPAGVVLVALTGYGQEEDRRRAVQAGFDHHLVKPVDVARLTQLMGTL
jgi:signal transduction histidine kinase/integral membrane sensor domain MASE1